MNKKIFSMLCMMTALGTVNVNATVSLVKRAASFVTVTAAVGVGNALQTSVENSTDVLDGVKVYQIDSKNPTANQFVKPGPSFKQAIAANATPVTTPGTTPTTLTGTYYTVPSWYVTDSKDLGNYFPVLPADAAVVTISFDQNDSKKISKESNISLQNNAVFKQVNTVTPFLDYSQISSLNGAAGIDVSAGLGYKHYISDSIYVNPQFNFGYYNAKSENAVETSYNEETFYTKSVKAQYVTAQTDVIKDGAATNSAQITPANIQTLYGIEADTSVDQSSGPSIKEALTFENQWYWNFYMPVGFQVTDKMSVEAIVRYQMTRCKLTVKEATGEIDGLAPLFDKGSDDSTVLNSIGLNGQENFYTFGEELEEAESQARMISGLVLGFGMNFEIAKNTTMGVQFTNVYNFARDFSIEGVAISPSAGDSTEDEDGEDGADGATTDFNAKMAQNQTSIKVNLTYSIPVGSECAPAA